MRGTNGDALYTNSTLALDPDTGKIVWYYQHLPGESHDMDEVFENILVDSGGRQSLFKMGKIGVLWELDRKTGKFLNAFDLGYQTLMNIDRTDRQGHVSPGHDAEDRRRGRLVPEHRRLQELARDGVSPADTGVLHSR